MKFSSNLLYTILTNIPVNARLTGIETIFEAIAAFTVRFVVEGINKDVVR